MMASLSPTDISRRNPQDEYELVQRVGSGTYGDVYKVRNVAPGCCDPTWLAFSVRDVFLSSGRAASVAA